MVTEQKAIDSPFGYRSTAKEVVEGIDLRGKIGVVTGGYSGIGTETVRALTDAGMHVIVGARRPELAKENTDGFENLTVLELDLADPQSIDAFADKVAKLTDKLDLLINNAAIMAAPLSRDERGFESQFAINHLGHFQLTARLWSLLGAAQGARVITLSSSAHLRGGLDLDDINFNSREYDRWISYAQAKSANALFALHLNKIGQSKNIEAFSVHPGGILTPLQRHLTREEQIAMGWFDEDGTPHELFKNTEEGASTTVWAATSPLLSGKGGVYCENCNIANPWEDGVLGGVKPHVRDEELAEKLWKKSEEMLGISFQ